MITSLIMLSLAHAVNADNLSSAKVSTQKEPDFSHEKLVSENPASMPVEDSSVNRGNLLYTNHCIICHDSTVHIRNRRKATSVADISYWVIRWQTHLKLSWSSEEIHDVTEYLNSEYYHFEESAITK